MPFQYHRGQVKFSAKKWKCEGDKDHVIIEVVFDANDIKAASAVADAKVNFINVHNPGASAGLRTLSVIGLLRENWLMLR